MGKPKRFLRHTRPDEVIQARFEEGEFSPLNLLDSGGIDIHADNLMPDLGEYRCLHEPYVAAAEDTDSHSFSP